MLSASMKSLDLGLDTTKPSESPSSGNINPDFELQVVVDSENGKRLDAPEIALYNGDTINLFSVKSLAKSDHLTANSVDWSYTTDTATTLVVASDKKSAVLNVTGVGSLTVNISCEGKTKTYSVIINVRPNLIANSVKTTSNAAFSYTDLDVDWSRELAFTASRKSNICSDVVKFSNNTPTVIRSIGSASLQVCLGVKLFDNNSKVILSSNTSTKVAAWDVSSDMANSSLWYSMGEYSTGAAAKRISQIIPISATSWEMIATRRFGIYKTSIDLTGATNAYTASISLLSSYTEGSEFNSSAVLGDKILAQSFTGATEPIRKIDSSFTLESTINMTFFNWTSISNATNTKAFLGGSGAMGALLSYSSGQVILEQQFRLANTSCLAIRSADIVVQQNKELLYSLCSEGRIDVYDITNISSPVFIKQGQLTGFEGEAYAIKIKPNSDTGIVVTNRGDFIMLNLRGLTTPSL